MEEAVMPSGSLRLGTLEDRLREEDDVLLLFRVLILRVVVVDFFVRSLVVLDKDRMDRIEDDFRNFFFSRNLAALSRATVLPPVLDEGPSTFSVYSFRLMAFSSVVGTINETLSSSLLLLLLFVVGKEQSDDLFVPWCLVYFMNTQAVNTFLNNRLFWGQKRLANWYDSGFALP